MTDYEFHIDIYPYPWDGKPTSILTSQKIVARDLYIDGFWSYPGAPAGAGQGHLCTIEAAYEGAAGPHFHQDCYIGNNQHFGVIYKKQDADAGKRLFFTAYTWGLPALP